MFFRKHRSRFKFRHFSTLRIGAVPIAGRRIASSRLRLFSLLETLGSRVSVSLIHPAIERLPDPSEFDLLYIQKAAWEPVVQWCERSVDVGTPIIYDIDDDFGCWPGMWEAELCSLAHAVTVDSMERAAWLRGLTSAPVYVVPCMIDLADDPARREPYSARNSIDFACTFGNVYSISSAMPYLTAIRRSGVATMAIGSRTVSAIAPGCEPVVFSVESFVGRLRSADVAVLCHGLDETGSRKGNNRLVMAMSLGIPAVTSPTRAYAETLADAGLPELICEGPDDVARVLEELRPAKRRAEIGNCFERYAWDRYAPEQCARKFWHIVEQVILGFN